MEHHRRSLPQTEPFDHEVFIGDVDLAATQRATQGRDELSHKEATKPENTDRITVPHEESATGYSFRKSLSNWRKLDSSSAGWANQAEFRIFYRVSTASPPMALGFP